jgi:hypothetical protein
MGHFGRGGLEDEEDGGHWIRNNNYSYQMRHPLLGFKRRKPYIALYHDPAILDQTGNLGGNNESQRNDPFEDISIGNRGNNQWYWISGVTRDAADNPLGGVTVKGFRTSDDAYIGAVVSDANGNYSFPSPYPSTQHYLVAFLAGSPDTAGSTDNTLTPTATP